MLTVAVPPAGMVTGAGENDKVEFVVRSTPGAVFGAVAGCTDVEPGGGGIGDVPGGGIPGVVAGVAGELAGAALVPELDGVRRRGVDSEAVFRPRKFASTMFGIRRMCGVNMMMISVCSRDFRSCAKKYFSIGMFLRPGRPSSDVASV